MSKPTLLIAATMMERMTSVEELEPNQPSLHLPEQLNASDKLETTL